MPRSKPTADALAARRQLILQAAGQVFLQHGFELATTLEIATRAKTSKRELYELFGTKQDLLTALIRNVSRRMQMRLDVPVVRNAAEFFEILERFGARFLEELLHPTRIGLYRLAIAEAAKSNAIARELDSHGRGPVIEAATKIFQQAAKSGIIDSSDITVLVRVFFGTLIGDTQTQLLLGLGKQPTAKMIQERATFAVAAIKRLTARAGA